ncbi:MAG: hypothetical protein MI867_06640 [Pseudomonadales bacterium]|nr:hypothetical protein [Pseudomonadales bacterium]
MIDVKSYLRIDDNFIEVTEFQGALPSSFFDEGVPYIEGAIELSINGQLIMDKTMWDYVDQLWGYILIGLAKVSLGKSFDSYFPDQALKFEFTVLNKKMVKVSCFLDEGTLSQVVDIESLVSGLSNGAEQFFCFLKAHAGVEDELRIITALKDRDLEVLGTLL